MDVNSNCLKLLRLQTSKFLNFKVYLIGSTSFLNKNFALIKFV